MLRVLEAVFGSPSGRFAATVARKIGSFGKEKEPHRIIVFVSRGVRLDLAELVDAICQTGSVCCHLARHENESVKHHACTDKRDPAQRLLQDDVDVAMHTRSVSIAHPP